MTVPKVRIVVRDSWMIDRGANPEHLLRAAKKYGLSTEEMQTLSVARLLETVHSGRPVVCRPIDVDVTDARYAPGDDYP
jgi:hypothetical protein